MFYSKLLVFYLNVILLIENFGSNYLYNPQIMSNNEFLNKEDEFRNCNTNSQMSEFQETVKFQFPYKFSMFFYYILIENGIYKI